MQQPQAGERDTRPRDLRCARPAAARGRGPPRAPTGTTNEVDHRRAVHREQLVVESLRDDAAVGGELAAHEQREHAAGEEERERDRRRRCARSACDRSTPVALEASDAPADGGARSRGRASRGGCALPASVAKAAGRTASSAKCISVCVRTAQHRAHARVVAGLAEEQVEACRVAGQRAGAGSAVRAPRSRGSHPRRSPETSIWCRSAHTRRAGARCRLRPRSPRPGRRSASSTARRRRAGAIPGAATVRSIGVSAVKVTHTKTPTTHASAHAYTISSAQRLRASSRSAAPRAAHEQHEQRADDHHEDADGDRQVDALHVFVGVADVRHQRS